MSWGTLSVRQADVVRKHVRGKLVHDLGAGNLDLSVRLLEFGARSVVAVDHEQDFVRVPQGVRFVQDTYQRFLRRGEHVATALVSWPPGWAIRGLEKIVATADRVIYLGVNDRYTTCGNREFFEAMRKRQVLDYVEDPANDLIVYGARRVRREPNDHELRAEGAYSWLGGDSPSEASALGRKIFRALNDRIESEYAELGRALHEELGR